MRTYLPGILLLLVCTATGLRAQGGPPLITDDPGTPGNGHWEINTAWTREHRTGETTQATPALDVNYGLGEHIELSYSCAFLNEAETGEKRESGFDNSTVGLKRRFLDEDRAGVAVSVYPQFSFHTPGSDADKHEFVQDENSFILPFEIQKDFGVVEVCADAGHVFRQPSSRMQRIERAGRGE